MLISCDVRLVVVGRSLAADGEGGARAIRRRRSTNHLEGWCLAMMTNAVHICSVSWRSTTKVWLEEVLRDRSSATTIGRAAV